jgi:hypothetical protein
MVSQVNAGTWAQGVPKEDAEENTLTEKEEVTGKLRELNGEEIRH